MTLIHHVHEYPEGWKRLTILLAVLAAGWAFVPGLEDGPDPQTTGDWIFHISIALTYWSAAAATAVYAVSAVLHWVWDGFRKDKEETVA